jgi:hypothetical protein
MVQMRGKMVKKRCHIVEMRFKIHTHTHTSHTHTYTQSGATTSGVGNMGIHRNSKCLDSKIVSRNALLARKFEKKDLALPITSRRTMTTRKILRGQKEGNVGPDI